MKFSYGYKTHKNETRAGLIDAPSREAVYQKLKERGIRPYKVELVPGVMNQLSSFGKRIYIIIILTMALVLSVVVIVSQTVSPVKSETSPQPRHQIYGDPALVEHMENTGYESVFKHPGDRVLAHFAQPGSVVKAYASRASAQEAATALADLMINGPDIFGPDAGPSDAPREVVELKRIVLGMREELRRYLCKGVGSPERYLQRLFDRQKREVLIYNTAKADLERGADAEKWARVNASLRAIGLMTIPEPTSFPDEDAGDEKDFAPPIDREEKK